MSGLLALTRAISPRIVECELTHLARAPIDVARAESQHRVYEAALTALGATVQRVEAAPEHPDSVFIEDTALVFDELAVLTRPGAESRRGEVTAVEQALAPYRALARIEAPGTLDGGDVFVVGRRVFAGRTARSNDAGIAQLAALLAPHGYSVIPVEVTGCLHLKSAATALDDATVLINPAWVRADAFAGLATVEIAAEETGAANIVRVGTSLLMAGEHPRTRTRIESRGYRVHTVPADELAKAEGAVTCCSLIFTLHFS
jgi:dimethylargininase